MSNKKTAILKGATFYFSSKALAGRIYEDESNRFPDGSQIRTSGTERIYIANGQLVAETRNTQYIIEGNEIKSL